MQSDDFGFDPCDHHVLSDGFRALDQGFHQGLADTATARVGADIDGMLDRVAITVKGAPVSKRGIAEDITTVTYSHKDGISCTTPIRVPC